MAQMSESRVTRSYTQRMVAPVDEVFPLICPVREAEWLEGWEYELVYSNSGLAEEGCIFTTRHAGEPESVWTITRHERETGIVEFVKVTPGVVLIHLRVALEDLLEEDGSLAHIAYTYTALSEAGERAIARHHTAAHFNHRMQVWEQSINHYLETGELLRY